MSYNIDDIKREGERVKIFYKRRSMKTRFEPTLFEIGKNLKLSVISSAVNIVLLAIAVVAFFYDTPEWARITFAVLLGFTALMQIFCIGAYEANIRVDKYALEGNTLTTYRICTRKLYKDHEEPKFQRIALESVKSIVIVAYYVTIMTKTGSYEIKVKSKIRKGEYVYDVLLLNSKTFTEFADNSIDMERIYHYDYLYDFCYDKETVLKLLALTDAELVVCGDFYRKYVEGVPEYDEYLDRIKKFETPEVSTRKKRAKKRLASKKSKAPAILSEREKAVLYAKLVFANAVLDILTLAALVYLCLTFYDMLEALAIPLSAYMILVGLFFPLHLIVTIWDLKMTAKNRL